MVKENLNRYAWLSERGRFANVSIDFGPLDNTCIACTAKYLRHRIMWYVGDAWLSAEGQSLSEAIDIAMKMEADKNE